MLRVRVPGDRPAWLLYLSRASLSTWESQRGKSLPGAIDVCAI